MKKSNGLITAISAVRSTVMLNSRAGSGNTMRASQLPWGSCCQLMKCADGVTVIE